MIYKILNIIFGTISVTSFFSIIWFAEAFEQDVINGWQYIGCIALALIATAVFGFLALIMEGVRKWK